MSAQMLLAGAFGALFGVGVWVLLFAGRAMGPSTAAGRVRRWLGERQRVWRLAGCVAAGVVVVVVTAWPVAGVLVAAGVWWLPPLLGPDRDHEARVERIDAVAAWTEQLRDLLASAAGLHQAIATTAPIAPAPIREAVQHLTEDLRQRETPPEQALTGFANRVGVPTADLVAAALSSAATRQAGDLGNLLSSLATATREQAATLVRIAATRARIRTAMRIIIATTLGLATLLLIFNPEFLAPFNGVLGQLVLAVIGALWAGALAWIVRLSRSDLGPRVLHPEPEAEQEGAMA